MTSITEDKPPPRSTDLEDWRQAIRSGRYRAFRMEAIVAAIQDLGLDSDTEVINALSEHASDTILRIVRRLVGKNHPNEGVDIVEDAHDRLINAMLSPGSADGKALRKAFVPRIRFRVADAIRDDGALREHEFTTEHYDSAIDQKFADETCLAREMESRVYVEEMLGRITDDRKRLAFRLHMEGVPLDSKRTRSIAGLLEVSAKTAGEWISEVQKQLRPIVGEQS